MIPYILPSSSPVPGSAAQRRDVDLNSHPLASPKSSVLPPHIEWHPQPHPSPSLNAVHDQSASGIASRSFVEFHHNVDQPDDLNLGTTQATSAEVSVIRDRGEYSVSRGTANGLSMAEHAANMPTVLQWPTHPHPLHYAGSSNGDSVRIMTCRHCRSEHYNTAVYSCVERGCNFHICLACALEQITAMVEAKRDQHIQASHQSHAITSLQQSNQPKRKTRKSSKADEDGRAEPLTRDQQRWDRSQGVGEGEMVMKMEPGVSAFDIASRRPVSYTKDRLKREYQSTKQWIAAVEYDAQQLGMRLCMPCSLHPEHPLIYHAISPPPPVHLPERKPSGSSSFRPAPSLSDRYFCDAVLSPHCMSHDLNKHLRPVYACPHCNFRLCLPCYRWYLLDHFSRLRASLSYEAADERISEWMREYKTSRGEDSRAIAYSELMSRQEPQWEHKRRFAYWIAGVSTLLCFVLVNAMITMQDSSIAYPLLNVVLILIGSISASILSQSLAAYSLSSHQRCVTHYRAIDSLYLDPSLAFFFHTAKTQPIPISAITPKQRDKLSDVYNHHANVIGLQRHTLVSTLLSLVMLLCGVGLLIAGVVVLLIQVICELGVYGAVDGCAVRAGVPSAVLLFAVLMWSLWVELVRRGWTTLTTTTNEWSQYRREERQRTKWQRRE